MRRAGLRAGHGRFQSKDKETFREGAVHGVLTMLWLEERAIPETDAAILPISGFLLSR